jgi:orotidine-5'-phosphate decarboxylase
MTTPREALLPSDVKERIIIALDVDSANAAKRIVDELSGEVGAFKIGLQLFTACGPALVREFAAAGHRIFLDLKFHDIPNTVARASAEAVRLGVWMLNVHASGGGEMMRAAADAVAECSEAEGIQKPLVIAVTVLTSAEHETLSEIGVNSPPEEHVKRLAGLADASGMDGVVASAREVNAIREAAGKEGFLVVTPGIRPINATGDDQRRVTTLRQAIAAGSNYVVVGRPVTEAEDRRRAIAELFA